MADTKRTNRDTSNKMVRRNNKPTNTNKGGARKGDKRKRTGPHLPNAMRREIELLNPRNRNSDDELDSDDAAAAMDVYEYEEAIPEEESRKNRRYDPVENFEFELPEKFKDENVDSDDEVDSDGFDGTLKNLGDNVEEDDDGRHARMLQEITGLPSDAFEGKKMKNNIVISEAYPENEYNPSGDVLNGYGRISIQDLLGPLHGKSGFSKLEKNVHRIETKSMSIHAPLRKPDREKLERKATYEQSKKDITKWEPLVKRNREAPTIYFDDNTDLKFSTVGAIASEFEPRTEFEKQMAALVNNNEVAEAHQKDGARLLELNKVSVEDVKDHQDRLAKMRNLLFKHEMKAKRIKKIKSKTYHRLLKKDRLKAAASQIETDPEAAKKLAMKQEFKRIQERSTLKHKNSTKWAKRILERGLSVQDDGTRAAISEQLHQHALLTRKMNSMKDDSNSDDSSDTDDDDISAGSDEEGKSKLLERAKQKTLEVLEDDEIPKSGVLSLPFMARGLEKRKAAAEEEAKLAIQEYETSSKQSEDTESLATGTSCGRRVFGAPKQQIEDSSEKIRSNNYYGNTDSEDDYETKEDVDVGNARRSYVHKDATVDPGVLRDKSEVVHDDLFKSFDEIVKNPGTKTTYDVALFASNSWKKKQNLPRITEQRKSKIEVDANGKNSSQVIEPALDEQEAVELENDSDTEGNLEMVDGILSAVDDSNYELPSQADLIRRAFAGDDVEEEFEKHKEKILNEENPEPEKPMILPGWGEWTHVQKKRGLPSWMLTEHDNAKKKREETLRKRKDAHLKNVIISEKVDKKAEKLHTKTLPYPYSDPGVYEQSIRMPIGPEYNPATAIGALNRPEVVKRSGVIINPIKFEDVNSHVRADEHKKSGKKRNGKKLKNRS